MSVFNTNEMHIFKGYPGVKPDYLLESALEINSYQPVTEGYVGKTRNLMEIEHLIGVMQRKYIDKNAGITDKLIGSSKMNLNDCPEKRKIEGLLEKEFGFKSVDIVIRAVSNVNALTCPKSILLRRFTNEMPKAVTYHGEKYYDAAHQYDFFMVIHARSFFELTPGEMTAMILHEVGHNFDVTTMTYVGDLIMYGLCFASGAIFQPFVRHIIGKFYFNILGFIDRFTPYTILKNAGIMFDELSAQVLGPIGSAQLIGRILANGLRNPVQHIVNAFTGFSGEKFADSFATAYGYGAETISLQHKLDTYRIQTDKGFIIDTWTWSGTVTPTILCLLLDCHPESQSRARMALDDMRELAKSKDLPPQMRKNVKADLERCEKAYKLFLNVTPDERDAIALRWSRNAKEVLFGGKMDLRSYLYSTSAVQCGIMRKRK